MVWADMVKLPLVDVTVLVSAAGFPSCTSRCSSASPHGHEASSPMPGENDDALRLLSLAEWSLDVAPYTS